MRTESVQRKTLTFDLGPDKSVTIEIALFDQSCGRPPEPPLTTPTTGAVSERPESYEFKRIRVPAWEGSIFEKNYPTSEEIAAQQAKDLAESGSTVAAVTERLLSVDPSPEDSSEKIGCAPKDDYARDWDGVPTCSQLVDAVNGYEKANTALHIKIKYLEEALTEDGRVIRDLRTSIAAEKTERLSVIREAQVDKATAEERLVADVLERIKKAIAMLA